VVLFHWTKEKPGRFLAAVTTARAELFSELVGAEPAEQSTYRLGAIHARLFRTNEAGT
jgi:hypothetical protein